MTEGARIPADLSYTKDHEWVRLDGGTAVGGTVVVGTVVRVGITEYAQSSLGDIVFVQLPVVGTTVSQGEALGEVESTKSVSDLFAPVAGTVTARNDAVETNPELANSDPYGDGWLLEITIADPGAVEELLDADAYGQLISS